MHRGCYLTLAQTDFRGNCHQVGGGPGCSSQQLLADGEIQDRARLLFRELPRMNACMINPRRCCMVIIPPEGGVSGRWIASSFAVDAPDVLKRTIDE